MRLLAALAIVPAFYCSTAAAQDDGLPVSVQAVLAHRGIPPASVSVHVEELGPGRPVLSFNADQPRTPASIMKLVPTLVALDVLGPAYTWTTRIYLLGELKDGTLAGDLLLEICLIVSLSRRDRVPWARRR